MVKGTLFLIDWDPACAEARADRLRQRGFRVEVESNNGGRAYRRIRTSMPDAIVVDLRKKPAHGREVASALRGLRATCEVPIVFLEEADQRELTRARVADALFADEDSVDDVLDAALEQRASRTTLVPSPHRRRAAAV